MALAIPNRSSHVDVSPVLATDKLLWRVRIQGSVRWTETHLEKQGSCDGSSATVTNVLDVSDRGFDILFVLLIQWHGPQLVA
jgi:hypothetical protein